MQACGGFYVLYDEQHDPPGSIIESGVAINNGYSSAGAALGGGSGGQSGMYPSMGATRWGGRFDDSGGSMRDE